MSNLPEQPRVPPPHHPAPWSIWHAMVILACSWLLSSLPALFVFWTDNLVGVSIVSCLLQDGCFVLPPLIIAGRRGYEISALGFRRAPLLRCLITGLLAGAALYALNAALSALIAALFPQSLQHQQTVVQLLALADNPAEVAMLVAVMVVFAPVAEELLFRSFLLPPLRRRFGRWPAIFICAAIFAAAHLDPWVFVPLFAGGAGFAWLYDKYYNIWYNIIAHAVWNAIAVVFLFIYVF